MSFKNAKIGEEVRSIICGKGKIIDINKGNTYPRRYRGRGRRRWGIGVLTKSI